MSIQNQDQMYLQQTKTSACMLQQRLHQLYFYYVHKKQFIVQIQRVHII